MSSVRNLKIHTDCWWWWWWWRRCSGGLSSVRIQSVRPHSDEHHCRPVSTSRPGRHLPGARAVVTWSGTDRNRK